MILLDSCKPVIQIDYRHFMIWFDAVVVAIKFVKPPSMEEGLKPSSVSWIIEFTGGSDWIVVNKSQIANKRQQHSAVGLLVALYHGTQGAIN